MYHTWCEATIDGKIYVVDPTLKYEKIYCRKHLIKKIKLSNQIPDVLVTDLMNSYLWKYKEEKSLKSLSKSYLSKCDPVFIAYLSQLDS